MSGFRCTIAILRCRIHFVVGRDHVHDPNWWRGQRRHRSPDSRRPRGRLQGGHSVSAGDSTRTSSARVLPARLGGLHRCHRRPRGLSHRAQALQGPLPSPSARIRLRLTWHRRRRRHRLRRCRRRTWHRRRRRHRRPTRLLVSTDIARGCPVRRHACSSPVLRKPNKLTFLKQNSNEHCDPLVVDVN